MFWNYFPKIKSNIKILSMDYKVTLSQVSSDNMIIIIILREKNGLW